MVGYRNAIYNYKNQVVDIYTWSNDGDRIVTSVECFPYFYYEDNSGSDVSIFNTNLKKKQFGNVFDKVKFLKERGIKRVFDNYNPVQQSLIDMYWNYNDTEDFAKYPLKIYFLDIEAVGQNGFSHPDDPDDAINIITIYDSLTNEYHVWGTKPYTPKTEDVQYHLCKSEYILLEKVLDFLKSGQPDILTGWNSDRYDVPYIINRMEKVLGKDETDTISPYGRRYTKVFNGKFGKKEIVHRIDGISCVDYMDIYKKFCPVNRESYKLDYIGQVELQENKVDYGDQSLYEFMMDDWDTFVDYNIQDVKLLVNLEKRLQYIQLLRMLSYIGCTTFESALGTVGVVTGAAGIEARKRNQKLCTFVVDEEQPREFEGGFVFHPIPGHHTAIVSFDANSLYPNTMITLNTSPETKMGKIENIQPDNISVRNVDGVVIDFTPKDFVAYLKKENIALSKANVLFSQKKRGILADLVDIYYKKRVFIREESKKIKGKIKNVKELSRQDLEIKIDQLDTKQQAIKIFLNSVYGACANKFCPIGDVDIAESITLTGQSVIKESREIFKRFVTKNKGITDIKELEKGLIAGDTDSLYVSFDQLVDTFSENKKITSAAYEVAEEFQKYLNDNIRMWAKRILNTQDCRFEFKRENMCDSGIFLEKKRYVLHVLDKEGIPSDSWKYTGVEVVTTTMPKAIKPYVKSIIENIVLTKCEASTNLIFKNAYDIFLNMDISEISISKGIKNLEKYEALSSEFNTCKGMPCHVKSAYYYNLLLDKMGITKKYEKIISGDKLKYFYVETPNKYGISSIAFKNKYPLEFKSEFKPDIFKMFEKDVFKCVERFYNIMNWIPRKPTEQLKCSLDDILG
jgi:DNA polymerase elongation subunit (family B)